MRLRLLTLLSLVLLAACGGPAESKSEDGGVEPNRCQNVIDLLNGCATHPQQDAGTEPAACADSTLIVGSPPASAVSINVDCAFATNSPDGGGAGQLVSCAELNFALTFPNGEHTFTTDAGAFAQANYTVSGAAAPSFLMIITAASAVDDGGYVPALYLAVPNAIANAGQHPVSYFSTGTQCFIDGACVGLDLGAGRVGATTYSLGQVTGGQLQIDSFNVSTSGRIQLHATGVDIGARTPDSSQATCADGRIHHRP